MWSEMASAKKNKKYWSIPSRFGIGVGTHPGMVAGGGVGARVRASTHLEDAETTMENGKTHLMTAQSSNEWCLSMVGKNMEKMEKMLEEMSKARNEILDTKDLWAGDVRADGDIDDDDRQSEERRDGDRRGIACGGDEEGGAVREGGNSSGSGAGPVLQASLHNFHCLAHRRWRRCSRCPVAPGPFFDGLRMWEQKTKSAFELLHGVRNLRNGCESRNTHNST